MNRQLTSLCLGLASAGLLSFGSCGAADSSQAGDPNIVEVGRRDLPITIKEDAELQAVRETVVRSEVEGQATIIYLIEEGSIVEKGTVLARLDVSDLEDKRANQNISVSKAQASMTQADKSLEILEKELTTRRNTAKSNLRIAEMELQKFLGKAATARREESRGTNREMVDKLNELVSTPLQTDVGATDAATDPIAGAADPTGDAPADGGPTADGSGDDAGPGAAVPESAPADLPQGVDLVTKIDPRKYTPLVDRVVELLGTRQSEELQVDPLDRDMGDMANQVLQQVDQIRLAMADLKYQEAYYGHSLRLAQKKFLTPNELEKDQIEYQRRLSKVGLAWNDLDLLISYELPKTLIKLMQDVENARLELQRVEASNDAERLRAQTDRDSKRDEYSLAKERLDNLDRQITNAVIMAPTPGLVIYARTERGRRDSEAIREGISIRERQELIVLPDTTKMQAVVKVQEAVVSQVREGQRAYVKVEAYADRTFTGLVTRVAQQADSSGGWMSSDRKVYTTTVVLDGDNEGSDLRSRMAAEVTIHVELLHDVLTVPLQAVRRDRSVNYVWKWTAKGPVAVQVDVGRHNSEHVVIASGIDEGDRVYLDQPVGSQPPNLEQPEQPMPALQPESAGTQQPGNGRPGAPADATVGPAADPQEERPGGDGRRPGGQVPGGQVPGGQGPGGQGPGGQGRPQLTEEQRAQFAEMRELGTRIQELLRQKYPERAADIDDRRARGRMLEEPEVRAALENELGDDWRRYDEMQQQMRTMMGGRSGGGGERGERGERGRGNR